MKARFFFLLLAAVLLGSVSVKAQSETPLKGDVNGDGKVDVADIVAVIEIMKNNGGTTEETTYYWYAGTTEPTAENLTTLNNVSGCTFGTTTSKPTWSSDNPESIAATNNSGNSSYFYYCFPTEWNVIVLSSDKTTQMKLAPVSTFTLNSVNYTVLRTGRLISNETTNSFYAKI